jgi:hypothetical protein
MQYNGHNLQYSGFESLVAEELHNDVPASLQE